MVKGISDNDIYKFSMQKAVCHLFPDIMVRYELTVRTAIDFPDGFGKLLREIVNAYASGNFMLAKDQKDYIREKIYYFDPVYVDFLKGYQFDPSEVQIIQEGPKIKVIIGGYWYRTILWEVPLMADISELFFTMTQHSQIYSAEKRQQINKDKMQGLAKLGVKWSEFGTRRRFSFDNHADVVSDAYKYGGPNFVGTSNLFLAMLHNGIPAGTQAHEWYMLHAALYGFKMANYLAMENWVKVYRGNLGTVLPDTFTTKAFLQSFDTLYAKLFDGGRQDSGDPFQFIELWVNHYRKLHIDPALKYILFSDNIKSLDTVQKINTQCKVFNVGDAYGIGTWMSNDVGVNPLNMVIKMTAVKINGIWVPTIKLSDVSTKNMGDSRTVQLCKATLNIE
jgi:nicotinate phosphoribosyltransferase